MEELHVKIGFDEARNAAHIPRAISRNNELRLSKNNCRITRITIPNISERMISIFPRSNPKLPTVPIINMAKNK